VGSAGCHRRAGAAGGADAWSDVKKPLMRLTIGRTFGESLSSWSLGLLGATWPPTTGGGACLLVGFVPKVSAGAESVRRIRICLPSKER
jgi:hypothetical protein